MITWTYTVLPMLPSSDENKVNPAKFLDLMNQFGAVGYELVCVYNDCLLFKKPCLPSEK